MPSHADVRNCEETDSWANQPDSWNIHAQTVPYRDAAWSGWRTSDEILTEPRGGASAHAGRALHGLRRAVLPVRRPAARSTT